MESYRLKNIIILTLALANVFLLSVLGLRHTQALDAQRQTARELSVLFSREGLELDASIVRFDDPPPALTLARDTEAEREAAAAFLGEELRVEDEGGGILIFSSDRGQAVFRASGAFEITGTLGKDPAALARRFCRSYGYETPETWFDASGSGTVSARQLCRGCPVEGCSVTFLAENNALRSVSGTFLPQSSDPLTEEVQPLSAATALTAFLNARRTSGAVVSAVTDIYPCYALQASASALTLTPAWCIVTNTIHYYVSCASGAVT